MSVYGIRIKDSSGNILLLTPNLSFIHSSGRNTMPDALNGDNTYGSDIDLPGTSAYGQTGLSVLVIPRSINVDLTLYNLNYYGHYAHSWFMNNSFTYYTRNESTGVMSSFTPDKSSPTAYDGVLGIYPRVMWDKMGATTFTSIRLFGATCYEIYDQSVSAFKQVYSIGTSQGIEKVDYVVSLKGNV